MLNAIKPYDENEAFSFDPKSGPSGLTPFDLGPGQPDPTFGVPSYDASDPKKSATPQTPTFGLDPTFGPSKSDTPQFSFPEPKATADPFTAPQAPPASSQPTDTSATTSSHVDLLAKLRATTDPQQKAVLQDQLGRGLFTDLKNAGHDVKWQGDTLIVDGRPYVLGGGDTAGADPTSQNGGSSGVLGGQGAQGGGTPPMTTSYPSYQQAPAQSSYAPPAFSYVESGIREGEGDPNTTPPPPIEPPDGGYVPPPTTPPPTTPAPTTTPPTTPPNNDPFAPVPGFELDKLNGKVPHDSDAKYSQAVRTFSQGLGSGVAISRGNLEGMVGYARAHGFPNAKSVGDDKIDFGDGVGPVDVVRADGLIVFQNVPSGPGGDAPPGGQRPTPILRDPSISPNTPSYDPGPANPNGFTPGQGPTYTPGDVPMDDIPEMSYEDLLKQMHMGGIDQLGTDYETGSITNNPLDTYSFDGFGDLGELGAGRTDAQTEDLIAQILAHPESYPPELVDKLKAASKDEYASMALQDDEDLIAQGYATGNQDSNWLASERLAARGRRDQGIVASNRNIDLTAAEKNAADRRSAASLGLSYAESKDTRNRANRNERFTEATTAEGLNQESVASRNRAAAFDREGQLANEQLRGSAFDRRNAAVQQNIDNQFKSAEEKRAAVALASDASLKAASLRGDRIALRESLAQKAAELGISADQVMTTYLLGLMDNAVRRYGIDVGASIDRSKIAEQSQEWQEELAYRFAALAQANDQFGATYGLEWMKFQRDRDNDAYQRYKDSQTSAEE